MLVTQNQLSIEEAQAKLAADRAATRQKATYRDSEKLRAQQISQEILLLEKAKKEAEENAERAHAEIVAENRAQAEFAVQIHRQHEEEIGIGSSSLNQTNQTTKSRTSRAKK